MPAHVQAKCNSDTCGGTCHACCLAVCDVCGAYEGSLTTDCPGVRVDFDKQEEVYTTDLDYTDALGWHHTQKMKGGIHGWPQARFS